jgi:hypothetical protein
VELVDHELILEKMRLVESVHVLLVTSLQTPLNSSSLESVHVLLVTPLQTPLNASSPESVHGLLVTP